MLNIDHPEVIAAQVAGSYARDCARVSGNRRRVEVVSNPVHQGKGLFGTDYYYVPVHIGSPDNFRAGDIVVGIEHDGRVSLCNVR